MKANTRVKQLMIGLCAMLLAASCGGDGETGGDSGAMSDGGPHDTGQEFVGDASMVVGTVEGQDITLAEVNLIVDFWSSQTPPGQGESKKVLQSRALQNIIDQVLLAKEAERVEVVIDEAEVDKMLDSWKGQAGPGNEWETRLAASKVTIESIRQSFRRDLLVQELVNSTIRDTIEIAMPAVEEFYNNHPEYFDREEVQASHILMMVGEDATEEDVDVTKAKLEAVLAEVKSGGDFAELAKEHSECSSAPNGGDLGYFTRDRMVTPFSDAAWTLEIGAISDIVRTQFGFHIIKLTDRRQNETPLPAVEGQIRQFLSNQVVQEAVTKLSEQLRGQASIENILQ